MGRIRHRYNMGYEIKLKDSLKGFTNGLEKTISPKETIVQFRKKLESLDIDILEETVRIDNGRLDIPVYFSVCGSDAARVIGNKKQMGKGGTPEQAEASAVMELAERFSLFSFFRKEKNFFEDDYQKIKDDTAISFEMIAESVHENSDDLQSAMEVFCQVPLKWTHGYNLTRKTKMLVPFNWFFTINQFNGSSAGNSNEEAILQGICEIVERHVSSLVSRNKLSVPLIDLESVRDPLAVELIDKFKKSGIKLYASDFTLDTGIPTVGALAWDPLTFPEKSEIVWTAGTTPDPEKSLIRAITEVAQLAGDFNTASNYVASGLPKFKNLEDAGFIIDSHKKTNISSLPNISSDNFKIEIERCASALSENSMEVILVDVTHPQLGIPAFYTIVPGAHFRERAVGTSVGMFSARLIAESGNPSWAVEKLMAMDRILPGKYYINFFLGVAHLSMGEPLSALEYFQKALELDPNKQDIPSIYSYMGVSLKELERYRDAIKILEKAERYDTERTDIYNLMGFCYFKEKKHEMAIECFKKVVQLDPSSAIDYANIGSNYRDMGDKKNAIRYYRLALELDPGIDFARESLKNLEKNHGGNEDLE
ncbi:YcaO-like family protein [Thermodesulfobacteriota bacterium]